MANTNKKEFAWTTEVDVKVITVNEFEQRTVKVCTLNEKQFVVVATTKLIKGEWKPVKNATFPMDVWKQVVEAMGDWELQNAFSDSEHVQVVEKPAKKASTAKKPAAKKSSEPKPAKAPAKKAPAKKASEPKPRATKHMNATPPNTFDPARLGLPVGEHVEYTRTTKLTSVYVHGETRKGKTVRELESKGFIVLIAGKEQGKSFVRLERVNLRARAMLMP